MTTTPATVDVVIVGAGFGGLYAAHRCLELGYSVSVFEAGDGVGGTWYWNRYPGARCDIDSMEYSYGFDDDLQAEWEWTERYSPQPEILRYLEHVADRFDLREHISFSTRVTSMRFDEAGDRWHVTTEAGGTTVARFVIMATGCLSSANHPDIDGIADFAGDVHHTGAWPHAGVDFAGKRVAVIGTGSSAVQAIPVIAEQAASVTVFQRTPTYVVPAHNGPLDPDRVAEIKADYREFRARNETSNTGFGASYRGTRGPAASFDDAELAQVLDERWAIGGLTFLSAFEDSMLSEESNQLFADYIRAKIRAVVDDPEVAELLCPTQIVGCKRLCVGTNYYETYNEPHVSLVSIADSPIERLTVDGVQVGGVVHEADIVVFATGFDAMTGTLLRIDIEGRAGATLAEAWAAGPVTYLGLNVPGFPNFFTVSGPGSPSVLTNMVVSIEQHVRWITQCITDIDAAGHATIESTPEAAASWVDHVNAVADFTLFPGCSSWYLGANVPGKTRVFMPLVGYPPYVAICNDVVADGYRGFEFA